MIHWMAYWFSPFPVVSSLRVRLETCGWDPLITESLRPVDPAALPEDTLLLYDSPDQLLSSGELSLESLVQGYRWLLSHEFPFALISIWRLEQCSEHDLSRGLPACKIRQQWPCPNPLLALVTKLALDRIPELLDSYLDLELESNLLGGEPDAHYRKRLIASLDPVAVLQAWKTPSDQVAELETLRHELAKTREALDATRHAEGEAREEAELTLLQLHQVQEELEHYFLLSRGQNQQLQRYEALMRRSHRLLSAASR